MKHFLIILSLLLTWSGAQAQNEKAIPVTKLPGEENLSLRERAERDFLMPVRRKKIVTEAPKAVEEDNTAAPESDVTAHYAESAEEAREAVVPAHTTRSYEARHTEMLAARRAAARREESRAEARAEARRAARHSSRRSSHKAKSHKSTTHSTKTSKSKSKAKSSARAKASKSTRKSKHTTARKSSSKKSSAHKSTKKSSSSKSKASSKKHRRR
ncbi:hypothetical protein [Hymenobacter terrenus]|uniref:hypothetical protein n=1 Tax=Hymenobacter terrenus TaxID=1629124 RepID=UPI0006190A27|nr:hypothetical protein [Hymenobacter terrenus]